MTLRSARGEAATNAILAAFRANGALLAAGDALAAEDGLTAARWQVLGAVALSGRPLTVPQIARRMGLTRQSVHATVHRLVGDGLLELLPNEDHRRSRLVDLTTEGALAYEAIDRRQAVWVDGLAERISRRDLETTARVLKELCRRLEVQDGDDSSAELELRRVRDRR
jgi:DNA-binding MarR family transcriptional regulator